MSLEAEFSAFEQLTEELFAAHRRQIDELLQRMGLSASQAMALFSIDRAGELKMSPLADCLGLSPGAATSLVERLVELGLVERRRIEDDRRAVCVYLTERGKTLLADAQKTKREMGWQLFQQLAPEARHQLIGALTAIREVQSRLESPQAPGP